MDSTTFAHVSPSKHLGVTMHSMLQRGHQSHPGEKVTERESMYPSMMNVITGYYTPFDILHKRTPLDILQSRLTGDPLQVNTKYKARKYKF